MLNMAQHQRGLTLIELIAAIVILGGAMVSMAAVMQANARSSGNATRHTQAVALARSLTTQLDRFSFATLPAACGTNSALWYAPSGSLCFTGLTGCDSATQPQILKDGAGNTLTGYSASLLVNCPTWPNVATANDIKQLTLTVDILAADDGGTLGRVQLDSYRANYPAGKVTRLP